MKMEIHTAVNAAGISSEYLGFKLRWNVPAIHFESSCTVSAAQRELNFLNEGIKAPRFDLRYHALDFPGFRNYCVVAQ